MSVRTKHASLALRGAGALTHKRECCGLDPRPGVCERQRLSLSLSLPPSPVSKISSVSSVSVNKQTKNGNLKAISLYYSYESILRVLTKVWL